MLLGWDVRFIDRAGFLGKLRGQDKCFLCVQCAHFAGHYEAEYFDSPDDIPIDLKLVYLLDPYKFI